MTVRILIDKDNTVYDIHDPWLSLYNTDNPDALLTKDMLTTWEMGYDIYKYLSNPIVYTAGGVIEDSVKITQGWIQQGYELAFVTSIAHPIAATTGLEWLSHNFPHIPNVFVLSGGHNKYWIQGDVLIDDGLHNHEQFEGIRIIYDQPWNSNKLRALNWQHIDQIVRVAVILLENYSYYVAQKMLVQQEGIL